MRLPLGKFYSLARCLEAFEGKQTFDAQCIWSIRNETVSTFMGMWSCILGLSRVAQMNNSPLKIVPNPPGILKD